MPHFDIYVLYGSRGRSGPIDIAEGYGAYTPGHQSGGGPFGVFGGGVEYFVAEEFGGFRGPIVVNPNFLNSLN